MALQLRVDQSQIGMNWSSVEKFVIGVGFVTSVGMGILEGAVVSGSMIYTNTVRKSELKKYIQKNLLEQRIEKYLSKALEACATKKEGFIFTSDEPLHIHVARLRQIIEISMNQQILTKEKFKSFLEENSEIVIDYIDDYLSILEESFFKEYKVIKIDFRTFFNLDIAKLVEEFKKTEKKISDLKEKIARLEWQIKDKGAEFYSYKTVFDTTVINLKNEMRSLYKLNEISINKEESSSSIPRIRQREITSEWDLKGIDNDLSDILGTAQNIKDRIFEANREAIKKEKESSASVISQLEEMQAKFSRSEKKFKQELKSLGLERESLSHKMRRIAIINEYINEHLVFLSQKEQEKRRGKHAAACCTFFGAYLYGGYQLWEIYKESQERARAALASST